MVWRMTKAVLILPGTALIYVPLFVQWLTGGWPFGGEPGGGPQLAVAATVGAPAFALAVRTMMLFAQEGRGTPAPWDPPLQFVVTGPYRYMRNPMLASVVVLILAEALATDSPALLIWAGVFFAINTVYFVFVEEPGLQVRFGDAYKRYKSAVPRWVPRLRPWKGPTVE